MPEATADARTPLARLLDEYDACADARAWAAAYATPADAWDACPRPDWMLWGLERLGLGDGRKLRLFACWCARHTPLGDGRTVWDLLTDQRSRAAVEVAERFAAGEATAEELAATEAATEAAAWTAAWAAVRPAARAAAWDAAWASAGAAASKAQADALREIYGSPFRTGVRPMPDPYTFPPDLAPEEESLVVACERCGGLLLTDPCPCVRALPPARPAAEREACGLDHLIVRPDGPPARERVPQTRGELLVARLRDARAERNLARDDLRAILSRLAVMIEHGERWTPGYLVRCLRELRAECRTALS